MRFLCFAVRCLFSRSPASLRCRCKRMRIGLGHWWPCLCRQAPFGSRADTAPFSRNCCDRQAALSPQIRASNLISAISIPIRPLTPTFFRGFDKVDKLKATPTPNKNGSYGIKGGYAIKGGSVCHLFCRVPLIPTDFYAIQTPIVWHMYFAAQNRTELRGSFLLFFL